MKILRFDATGGPGTADFWIHELDVALWRDEVVATLGEDYSTQTAQSRWGETTMPEDMRFVHCVAVDGDDRLGVCTVELPQRDNLSLAYLSLVVRRGARGTGVGSALLDAALECCRSNGRSIFQGWTFAPLEAKGPRRVRPDEGPGELDADDPTTAFLLARGFELRLLERLSRVTLPAPEVAARQAEEAKDVVGDDYAVVQWAGPIPDDCIDDIARLVRAMSTDIPNGGAAVEETNIDAARMRRSDARYQTMGLDRLFTAVRHVGTGRIVGFSSQIVAPGMPTAQQAATIILGEHRGHGLGWLLKTAAHAELRRRYPHVERVATENATGNAPMLAINERIGFEPFGLSGWFERRD